MPEAPGFNAPDHPPPRLNAADNLRVEGVWKTFTDEPVLKDVSFSARPGEFLTLLGPSGCGKTTLLRVIAGLELPDRGAVFVAGRDVGPLPAHRRPVNTVFQNYALFPHLTVFENIAFGLRSRKFAQPQVESRCAGAFQMLQLEPFACRYPHELSGGQKQRVALARALVNEPELLLLDEPMSALDAKLRGEVQIELRRLQRRLGKTFLLVTHDQDEAMTVSDRIIVMCEGRIEQMGTPSEIYDHPVNRFVAEFLGSANLIAATSVNENVQTALGAMRVARRPTWESGTLAIRPERIRISAEAPPVNAVRARVHEAIYRGDHVDFFVKPERGSGEGGADFGEIEALRVRASGGHGAGVGVGDKVWLELPEEHLEALVD